MALGSGSSAIDAGLDTTQSPYNLTTDQRGYGPRNMNGTVDIGGFENGATAPGQSTATWTGATSTDWNVASNWSTGVVPNSSTAVDIPATTNEPVLSSAVAAASLTIESGASLTLAGYNLTDTGSFTNQGTVVLQGNETVSLTQDTGEGTWEYVGDGTGNTLNIQDFGSTDYYNLVIDDTHATKDVFQDPSALSVAGALTIDSGTLQLGAGGLAAATNGTTVDSGGALDLNGQSLSLPLTLNGTGVGNSGALTNSSTTAASASGSITLGSNTSISSVGSLTLGGTVTGSGSTLNIAATGSDSALNINNNIVTGNGAIVLQATGNLTVGGGVTINSGTAALTLAADVTASGTGDNGVGTLTINDSDQINGSNITLRGADEDIGSTASVGSSSTTSQVTIQSSVESRPMSIGGTNNAAVPGINLTSAELARIATTSAGTITIGDSNQTGNITISNAMPATTAGAATDIVQSSAEAGQIILDDGAGSGAALNGNGGSVSLTAGTGGIVEDGTNVAGTADLGNAPSVSLTSPGAIGSLSAPLQLTTTGLSTNTSANNDNQYFSVLPGNTVTAQNLDAGTGTIYFLSGNVSAGASGAIASSSSLNLGAAATFDVNGNSQTLAGISGSGTITDSGAAATLTVDNSAADTFAGSLTGANLSLDATGSGTLTLTGANTYGGTTTIGNGSARSRSVTAAPRAAWARAPSRTTALWCTTSVTR